MKRDQVKRGKRSYFKFLSLLDFELFLFWGTKKESSHSKESNILKARKQCNEDAYQIDQKGFTDGLVSYSSAKESKTSESNGKRNLRRQKLNGDDVTRIPSDFLEEINSNNK